MTMLILKNDSKILFRDRLQNKENAFFLFIYVEIFKSSVCRAKKIFISHNHANNRIFGTSAENDGGKTKAG